MRDPLRNPGPSSFNPERDEVLRNMQLAIASASASLMGFLDNDILVDGLDTSDPNNPYLYRIAGCFTLATTVLEHFCQQTDESPLEVIQDLGYKANLMLASGHPAGSAYTSQDPPEDDPPGLEPV